MTSIGKVEPTPMPPAFAEAFNSSWPMAAIGSVGRSLRICVTAFATADSTPNLSRYSLADIAARAGDRAVGVPRIAISMFERRTDHFTPPATRAASLALARAL